MKTTTMLFLWFTFASLYGQSVDNQRFTTWQSATHTKIQPNVANVVNVIQQNADATGSTSIDNLLTQIISSFGPQGGIVYFPKGTYLIQSTIQLKTNVFLAGDGAKQTKLIFNLNGSQNAIEATGSLTGQWMSIENNAQISESMIICSNHGLSAGDLIRIKTNDQNLVTSSWAKESVGQLVEVDHVDGNQIFLISSLRLKVGTENQAQFSLIKSIENCGVLNLSILRKDQTTAQTSNIQFKYTKSAAVIGVSSMYCNYAHVNNVYAYRSLITGSYFTEAFDFGGGGKAYGVVLAYTSSECLVENNQFERLRHSILFQAGPNGNVVAYNYSTKPYWTGVLTPSDFAGDIVMHGNYPFFNLVEGNICQNLVIDDSHGKNGPFNTFFRNRVENAGIFMNVNSADDQNFIGNEITGTGTSSNGFINFPKGLYVLNGLRHYEYSNNKNGQVLPTNLDVTTQTLYLANKAQHLGDFNFPSIGNDKSYNTGSIPAKTRFDHEAGSTINYEFSLALSNKFIAFTVEQKDQEVDLQWQTTNRNQCKLYEVHRLGTEQGNTVIGTLTCAAGDNGNDVYEYIDYNSDLTGDYKYFVKQVDVIGEETFSDTLGIVNQNSTSIKTIGNGQFATQGFEHNAPLRVYNLSGQCIHTGVLQLDGTCTIKEIPASGVYFIMIDDGRNSSSLKISYQKT
ncbi:MAG: hypothetical protein ACI8ZN_000260 [Bacteroidia bacterium]|jgi:hypothetical protein